MRMFVNIMRLLSLLGVFATLIVKSPPSSCVANASSNIFCKPTNGIVKQSFHNTHKAMDISGASGMVKGPEVYAPYDGRVVYVGRAIIVDPLSSTADPTIIYSGPLVKHS